MAEFKELGDNAFAWEFEDGYWLELHVTSEGIIMDYCNNSVVEATFGQTADELVGLCQ